MADKRLFYNLSGSNIEIPNSGSRPAVYFNDILSSLVVGGINISSITSSITNNGILTTDTGGKLSSIATSSLLNNSYLQSNGISWTFLTASGQITGNFTAGSDVSGSFANATMTSVSNITTGILSANNGGTGITSFTSGGVLIKDGTSTIKTIKPDSANAVLRPSGPGWISGGSVGVASSTIQTQYFGCPTPGVTYNTTWAKPLGIKNVRVILQAGGGGGGGGCISGPSNTNTGAGGGAGGLSCYDIANISADSASVFDIVVGAGGAGGPSIVLPTLGDQLFSQGRGGSNSYVKLGLDGGLAIANGGTGGLGGRSGLANAGTQGVAGWGNLSRLTGGDGRSKNNTAYVPSGIGSGGGGAGSQSANVCPAADGGDALCINSYVAVRGQGGGIGVPGTDGGAIPIAFGISPTTLYIGGGGGGGGAWSGPLGTTFQGTSGGNGKYGSGGGGAGALGPGAGSTSAKGGDGGDGYVFIIYW